VTVNSSVNLKDAINVYEPLDPSKTNNIVDDDATVVTSNKTKHTTTNALGATDANTMSFATTHAVAYTGATSLFLMEGLKMENVQIATNPLGSCEINTHMRHHHSRSPYYPHWTHRLRIDYGVFGRHQDSMQSWMHGDFY
jgi:hypothetical protein